MSNLYILQGGPECFDLFEEIDHYGKFEWHWTVPKSAKKDDLALIYLTSPLSRLVGTVSILDDPFFNHRETSAFQNEFMHNKWCARVGDAVAFEPIETDRSFRDLSMRNLRKLFAADWGWVRYPRGSVLVPAEHEGALLDLIAPYISNRVFATPIPEGGEL